MVESLLQLTDMDGMRFEYSGYSDKEFAPDFVRTDILGHVLVSDKESGHVHIMNQEGDFLQYIQLEWGTCFDIDSKGHLWMESDGEYIGVYKYLKYT